MANPFAAIARYLITRHFVVKFPPEPGQRMVVKKMLDKRQSHRTREREAGQEHPRFVAVDFGACPR